MSTTTTTEVKVVAAPAAITQIGKVAIVTGASRYVINLITLTTTRDMHLSHLAIDAIMPSCCQYPDPCIMYV
jgi:hypothetical protein